MHRVSRALTVTLLALVGLSALGQGVGAAENPLDASVPVLYMDGGRSWQASAVFEDVGYDPDLPNYCGHVTSQGHGFEHAHMPHGFPFVDGTRTPPVTVTAGMCDEYWDLQYNVAEGLWGRGGGATMARNCHGFAMGKSFWVNDRSTIIEDDYTLVTYPVGGCISSWPVHSYKVMDVYTIPSPRPPGWPPTAEKTRTEKNWTSGTYSIIYPYPGDWSTERWYTSNP